MKTTRKLLLTILTLVLCFFKVNSLNPADRFADRNLGYMNSFTPEEDLWNAFGNYYQFGRNVAFSHTADTVEKADQLTSPKNAIVWSEKFITSKAAPHNWYQGGTGGETWKSIVNKTMEVENAPQSYLGYNDGDPCPVGYHVPTMAELKSIIYQVKFAETGDRIDVGENGIDIDGSGITSNYVADYRHINPNTNIGLRFKNTSNAMAFKYEWVDNKGLKVSAKPAGALTLNEIASNDYDWSDAVVRLFPSAGTFNAGGIWNPSPKAGWGSYLSSQSRDNGTVWALVLHPTSTTGTTSTTSTLRTFGTCIRCVKDYVDSLTSVNEKEISEYKVYPRVNSIYIESTNIGAKENVTVYDIYGKTIREEKITEHNLSIRIDTGGLYFVKIGSQSYKVFIK
jgi:hypothetical protein